jgi:hypothetical protein
MLPPIAVALRGSMHQMILVWMTPREFSFRRDSFNIEFEHSTANPDWSNGDQQDLEQGEPGTFGNLDGRPFQVVLRKFETLHNPSVILCELNLLEKKGEAVRKVTDSPSHFKGTVIQL